MPELHMNYEKNEKNRIKLSNKIVFLTSNFSYVISLLRESLRIKGNYSPVKNPFRLFEVRATDIPTTSKISRSGGFR
jgi:hypothetical protein